jgi:DNA-binding Xre family transcriptional regulator
MNLGKSLKMALAYRVMRNKELAAKMNTSTQQVSNWLSSGNIKQSNLVEICRVLDMKVSEFIALGE